MRIIGANIPDVQLPDQYQQHLATRERVAKELLAYEREWELIRKQRIDTLLIEIERTKKERDARLIEVSEAQNKARQDVAQMLQERETEAQRVQLEIESRGRAALRSAENEATALSTSASPIATTAPCCSTSWRCAGSRSPNSWCATRRARSSSTAKAGTTPPFPRCCWPSSCRA